MFGGSTSPSEISDDELRQICQGISPPPITKVDVDATIEDDGPPPLSMGAPVQVNCDTVISDELKAQIIEMGTTWIRFLNDNQRKVLSEAKRKIVAKFNIERDAFRAELAEKMKSKLEEYRVNIDVQMSNQLKEEVERFVDSHRSMLAEVKKKQWCKVCLEEAQYACCWNTAYCGVDCQGRHWPMHQRTCRRIAESASQQNGV